MRIAVVNPPFPAPPSSGTTWVTVPPAGYGGIQWFVAHLTRGLAELGHEVMLLGAPESAPRPGIVVTDRATPEEIRAWVLANSGYVVHDLSNDVASLRTVGDPVPYLSTHHFTGPPRFPQNRVFVSRAQRAAAHGGDAPVLRIPVDADAHDFTAEKDGFALFLGRVSPWKGAREAAEFCALAGVRLVLAGPTWEDDYAAAIARDFGEVVEFVGDVGGAARRSLLARARVVLAFSRSVPGPWGHVWCEPGATVVGEAAVSGTPVISSDNGCLPEIVPLVGTVIPEGTALAPARARRVLEGLPRPAEVREAALAAWHYRTIAEQYEELYERVETGSWW